MKDCRKPATRTAAARGCRRDQGGPGSLASAMRLLERVCPPWGDAQASSAGAHDAGALAFVTKPFTHEGTRGGTCRRGMREEVMIVISLAKENVNISVVPLLPAESRRPFWARTPGGNVFCCDRICYICSCLLCEQKWDTSVFIAKALYSHSLWRATNHTAPLTTPPHTFLLRFLSMSTVHGGQLASCRIHTVITKRCGCLKYLPCGPWYHPLHFNAGQLFAYVPFSHI